MMVMLKNIVYKYHDYVSRPDENVVVKAHVQT